MRADALEMQKKIPKRARKAKAVEEKPAPQSFSPSETARIDSADDEIPAPPVLKRETSSIPPTPVKKPRAPRKSKSPSA